MFLSIMSFVFLNDQMRYGLALAPFPQVLAAVHSEKKGSTNVEVDYTRVKFLRKPAGSAPGFVTYETYYSAVVDARDPFAKV